MLRLPERDGGARPITSQVVSLICALLMVML
ncbi:Uncharacterized protein OBRU01_23138, partial [Operophtera brumata]